MYGRTAVRRVHNGILLYCLFNTVVRVKKRWLINEVSSKRKPHNDVSFIELLFLNYFYSVSFRSDGGIR